MKRWKSILLTVVLSLVLVAPVFGFGDTEVNTDIKNSKLQGTVGDGNIGIQTNGAVKDNVFNTGTSVEGGITANGGEGGAGGEGGSVNIGTGFLSGGNFSPVAKGGSATIEEGAVNVDVDSHDRTYNTNTQLNSQKNEQNNTQLTAQGQQQQQANKQVLVIEDAENKRNLPGAHGGAYAAKGPDYREKAKDSANVAPMDELLSIRKVFTLAQLKVLAGRSGLDFEMRVFAYGSHRVQLENPKTGTKGMDDSLTITVVTDTPSGKDMAFIRVAAEEVEVDTVNVFALAAIEALRHGATHLYIAKADFARMMNASAWGLMFGGSGSIIKDSGMTGTGAVIAPGVGYGESESGYEGLPYIRAYAFE